MVPLHLHTYMVRRHHHGLNSILHLHHLTITIHIHLVHLTTTIHLVHLHLTDRHHRIHHLVHLHHSLIPTDHLHLGVLLHLTDSNSIASSTNKTHEEELYLLNCCYLLLIN